MTSKPNPPVPMNPAAIPTTRQLGVVVVGEYGALETQRAYTSALNDFNNYIGDKADLPVSLLTLAECQGFETSSRPGKSASTRKRDMQAVRALIRHAIAENQLPPSFWNSKTPLAKAASSLNATPTTQPTPALVVPASIASAPVSTPAPATRASGPASGTMTPPSNPAPTAALPDPGELLTFAKARAVADVSRGTLWRWTKAGLHVHGREGVKRIGLYDLKRFLGIPVPATPAVP